MAGPRYCILSPGKTLAALIISSPCQEVAELVTDDSKFLEQSGTCLMYACQHGRTDVVLMLLSKGADLNYLNDAPFRAAAFGGHTKPAKMLLEKGADVHSKNDNALICAAQEGHCETVRFLLQCGAHSHTPLNIP
jgi:ankyrin repeat protein